MKKIDARDWEFETEAEFNDLLAKLWVQGVSVHETKMLLTKEQIELIQSWLPPVRVYNTDFGDVLLCEDEKRWENLPDA